jgi:hypothetical protein
MSLGPYFEVIIAAVIWGSAGAFRNFLHLSATLSKWEAKISLPFIREIRNNYALRGCFLVK